MYILTGAISFVLIFVVIAEEGDPCVTPNGENATCISIYSCRAITQAITYLDKDAIDFAKKSHCGFNNKKQPLVCCGTAGYPTTTPAPATTPLDEEISSEPEEVQDILPEQPIHDVHLPDQTLCGIQNIGNRLAGGDATEIDEFPWMAILKYVKHDGSAEEFRCGGTLISRDHVLTAAQCLYIPGYNLTEVRLGEWRISTKKDCTTYEMEDCGDEVQDIAVVEKTAHPLYSNKSGNNDIALLRLKKRVKFNDFIRPICLPSSNLPPPPPGTLMDIAGWGVTENGTQSDVKLKIRVPMIAQEDCLKVYTNYTHYNPHQACAGGQGGQDTCKGDSGGPLMRKYRRDDEAVEEQWYQEGLVYRAIGCGQQGVPSLYTRVSRYTTWILNNLK